MLDIDEIKRLLKTNGINIKSIDRLRDDKGVQLKGADGEIINVYDTGKILPQGKNIDKVRSVLKLENGKVAKVRVTGKPKVFVVYGHDSHAKAELQAMLLRWDLDPIILDQLPSGGTTIIEKLEEYIDENEVKFGVVLATPDDEGYPTNHPEKAKKRARQNVVLELGMLLSRLGRERVAIFRPPVGQMEPPSDIDGLLFLDYQNSITEKKAELARELEHSIPGFQVTASKI